MTLSFPSSPDSYEIRHELGRGGTAIVYLAHDIKHDRPVALKVLQPNLMLTPERFLAEIRTIAGLQHPHILALYDSGVWNGSPFFAMPYIAGETLETRMEREGPLSAHVVIRIAKEIGDALVYAHRRGVVHRDIKPANILLADDHAYVADFGIAHVIDLARKDRLTTIGLTVGTPAYMSPEQAAGEQQLDGRSDLYSLGSVLFEMLSGEPPFRGPSPRQVNAQRMLDPAPPIRTIRPSAPEVLAHVVDRSLSRSPDDRYADASEFMAALAEAEREMRPDNLPTGRQVSVIAALVVVVAGATWALARGITSPKPTLDRSTYAVFPFRHAGISNNIWLDGDGCARLLHDAMARWQGVHLVDDMRVNDVWTRRKPRTVAEALSAAEALNAGTLTWGEVISLGDSLEIRAAAYDVARGPEATRQVMVRVARDAPQLERAFATLADSLLVGGGRSREGAASSTHNLRALQQFLDGRAALDHFDLHTAAQRFREAVESDESYAHAQFWLARTLAWEGEAEPASWGNSAARAVTLSKALPERDAAHAGALVDLSQGRMADACRRYRTLIRSDSLDFAAWFGLGDCNARDAVVVRDARSPTGYSFRGSLHAAIIAYRRALALVPSFHLAERGLAFSRLSRRVIYSEESRMRRGIALAPDTQRFGAFPSFLAETLAFVPAPFLIARDAANRPATERRAVIWGAETSRQLMGEWVSAYPASDDAQESYALALESSGNIVGSDADMPVALSAARRALRGSSTADARSRRTAMVARLLLKADSVAATRTFADSVLQAWTSPSPYQAGYLAGLAAITGHATQAARLMGIAAADSEHVPFVAQSGRRALPGAVTASALVMESYASMGGPRDSIRAAFLRTVRLVDTWIPVAERADARRTLLRGAFVMAYDLLAPIARYPIASDRDLLLELRLAMAKRDTAAIAKANGAFEAIATSYSPGTVGMDRLYHHATALLALGDTARATAELDAALTALPRARWILLKILPQAGAVVPTMVLRSQLALRAKDLLTFERWARPAVALWGDADPELRAPVNELKKQLDARH